MKRKLAAVLGLMMALSLSCSSVAMAESKVITAGQAEEVKPEVPAIKMGTAFDMTQAEYEAMTVEDLLGRIKDIEQVTKEEYVGLLNTLRFCEINNDLSRKRCITDEAIGKIKAKAKPAFDSYADELLASEFPQVRGYGISSITSLFGVNSTNLERAMKLLETEKDDFVLYCATRALNNEARKGQEYADFLFTMAEHENPKIRLMAINGLSTSWSVGVEGSLEKVIEHMHDEDLEVRKFACSHAGGQNDERVIDPLVEILDNPDEVDLHGSCIESLVYLWYGFPFYKGNSERAYHLTMDYLKRTPRDEKTPAWTAVISFKQTSTQDSFKIWKENATYFDTDEVFEVMKDIILDPNASFLARTNAFKPLQEHCPERLEELRPMIEALDDKKAKQVQQAYDKLFK